MPFCKEGRVWFYAPNVIDSKLEPTYNLEEIKKELTKFPLYTTTDIVDIFAYGILVLNQFNESNILLVGGEKMKYTEEDFMPTSIESLYTSNNPIDIFIDHLPTRDDLMNLNW